MIANLVIWWHFSLCVTWYIRTFVICNLLNVVFSYVCDISHYELKYYPATGKIYILAFTIYNPVMTSRAGGNIKCLQYRGRFSGRSWPFASDSWTPDFNTSLRSNQIDKLQTIGSWHCLQNLQHSRNHAFDLPWRDMHPSSGIVC